MHRATAEISNEHPISTTCFMAIELSRSSWLVAVLTPLRDKISLQSIPCGAVERLMEIIDRTVAKVA